MVYTKSKEVVRLELAHFESTRPRSQAVHQG